jgi:flavin reductase (DIM6/NTAB) family NADH-FMN oxidoreductase RutF
MEEIAAPFQTVFLSCRGNADLLGNYVEKDNVTLVNFHSAVSRDPPLYLVSLHKKRLSVNIIREAKSFVINFMPYAEKEKAQFVDKYNGLQLDKFRDLPKEEARVIDAPRLSSGVGFLECRMEQEFDLGDHIAFIGRVIHAEHRRDAPRLFNMGMNDFVGIEYFR